MDLKRLRTFGKSHSHGESARSAGDPVLIPGSGSPWRRKQQPTPVFLPGKFHGQRSLAGYGHGIANSRTRLTDFTYSLQNGIRGLGRGWQWGLGGKNLLDKVIRECFYEITVKTRPKL